MPPLAGDGSHKGESVPDAARERASALLRYRSAVLAGNIMRIVRGAGKPYSMTQECLEFLEAFNAYTRAFPHGVPADEIANALDFRRELDFSENEFYISREVAIETIVRGSLQIAASRLLEQKLQHSAGESELLEGVREMERLNDESRTKFAAQVARAPDPSTKPYRPHHKK